MKHIEAVADDYLTHANDAATIQQYRELMTLRPFAALVVEKLIAGYLADVKAWWLP